MNNCDYYTKKIKYFNGNELIKEVEALVSVCDKEDEIKIFYDDFAKKHIRPKIEYDRICIEEVVLL